MHRTVHVRGPQHRNIRSPETKTTKDQRKDGKGKDRKPDPWTITFFTKIDFLTFANLPRGLRVTSNYHSGGGPWVWPLCKRFKSDVELPRPGVESRKTLK